MNVGVCTTDFPTLPAEELFAKIAELGFSSVQLCFGSVAETNFACSPHFDIPACIPEEAVSAIRSAAEKHRLDIVACNGTFNMAHPNPEIRTEGLKRFEAVARATARLGISYISLCSGTLSEVSMWSPHPQNSSEIAWENMRSTMEAAVKIAERFGIVLAIETEAANVIDTPAKARRIMDEIGSPALKMIIDGANLFHPGTADPRNVRRILTEAFEVFGKDIVLAHGKDIAQGGGIEFVPTGEGIMDFPFFAEKLREYGFSGEMLLHGIFDAEKMKKAVSLFKNI